MQISRQKGADTKMYKKSLVGTLQKRNRLEIENITKKGVYNYLIYDNKKSKCITLFYLCVSQ